MKRIVFLLVFLFAINAEAQWINLSKIDPSGFPIVTGQLIAVDKDGNRILNINPGDCEITENGAPRKVLSVSCPEPKTHQAVSAVLVVDVSGSMQNSWSGMTNMDLAKTAANAWIDALPDGGGECAITSFDDKNYFNQDFTTDKIVLKRAVAGLTTKGGTDYNYAMINPLAGGVLVAESGHYKKVVILISDGLPNFPPDENRIIQTAKDNDITIYCVSLNMPAPACMKHFADQTGGEWFENVTSVDEAKSIFEKLAISVSDGADPCTITWESEPDCEAGERNVVLTLNPYGFIDSSKYIPPANSVYNFDINPDNVYFKNLPVGVPKDTTVNITSRLGDFHVSNITCTNPAFFVTPTNFDIADGETKQVTLRFTPVDSNFAWTKIIIETDKCSDSCYASAYYTVHPNQNQTLKIESPNGGEVYVDGSDTLIIWSGISAKDTVTLEYSIDSGKTWTLITNKATGLSYPWKNIPNTPSTKCLMKVTQHYESSDTVGSLICTLKREPGLDYTYGGVKWNYDGSLIAYSVGGDTLKILDGKTGKFLFNIPNANKVFHFTWNKVNNELVGAIGESICIWDATTGDLIKVISDTIGSIADVQVTDDGSKIAVMYDYSPLVSIFNRNTSFKFQMSPKKNTWIKSFKMSRLGNYIVTINPNDSIYVLDVKTGEIINRLPTGDTEFYYAVWSPDENYISTAFDFLGFQMQEVWNWKIGYTMGDFGMMAYNCPIEWFNDSKSIIFADFLNLEIVSIPDVSIKQKINIGNIRPSFGSLSPNNKFYTFSSIELPHEVIIYDLKTEQPFNCQFHHNSLICGTIWSPNSNELATMDQDSLIKIWRIVPDTIQTDVSDSLWSIVSPNLMAKEVDMKNVLVGNLKDSTVFNFIENGSNFPVRIDTAYIAGGDADQFAVTYSVYPLVVPANKSQMMEFLFQPTSVGYKESLITIVTQSDTLRYKIYGNGIQPKLEIVSKLLDFDSVLVGTYKDSLFTEVLRNAGTAPITINSIKFLGPNTTDFRLSSLGTDTTFTIQPGDYAIMPLRFTPSNVGRTSGQLAFYHNEEGSPAIVQLFGTGYKIEEPKPELSINIENLDFGRVKLGNYKDSLFSAVLTNSSKAPAIISGIKITGLNSSEFLMTSGAADTSFTLALGESIGITLRFTPAVIGKRYSKLEFYYNGDLSPAVVDMVGEGYKDSVIITPPDTAVLTLKVGINEASPSDLISIPIYLLNANNLENSGITGFKVDLTFNTTLLYPYDYPKSPILNELRTISLDNLSASPDKDGIIGYARFKVGLGDNILTDLNLSNVKAIGGIARIYLINGKFSLTGVCPEGGKRLINPNGKLTILATPNPTQGILEINANLIENGETTLTLTDISGRTVNTIFDQIIENPGNINLSISTKELISGEYLLILKSPTIIKSERIQIIK